MRHFGSHSKNWFCAARQPLICCLILAGILLLAACSPGDSAATSLESGSPAVDTGSFPGETPPVGSPPAIEVLPVSHTDNRPDSRPDFYLGVDLSYVNEMDDCGAVYRENGLVVDAFDLFSRHGASLVRARLWYGAEWTAYSNPDDIKRTFRRAVEAGMFTLLDFHYSDNWADPSKQAIPVAWQDLDQDQLVQAVYDYTYQTLIDLYQNQLMPDFVQVGNEVNGGLLKQIMELDWSRDARLFNAGIQAVRDAGRDSGTEPKIILHIAQPENAGWWFTNALANGITDFDIIGLSYYPQWSSFSLADLGVQVSYLRQAFQKDVMVVETAYLWTMDAVEETASNILNQGIRGYSFTPEGQRQYMVDLSQALILNGGLGVVYWEPAWVSTGCSTRWGQGSHWENATFFDFNNQNEVHQGIEFLGYPYLFPDQVVDGLIEPDYGEPILEDPVGDNLDHVEHLDLVSLYARNDASSLYLGLTIAGDIYQDPWGSYLIYIDTTGDGSGAPFDVGQRPISAPEPYLPEFRVDLLALDRKGTVSASLEFFAWDGSEWRELTLPAGTAILSDSPSTIELQIPRISLGDPGVVNLAAVSTGRGRIHTAGDILGTPNSPTNWKEPVSLVSFARYELSSPGDQDDDF